MLNLKEKENSQKEIPIVFDYRKFNFSKLEYIEPKKKNNVIYSNIYYT